MVGMKAAVQAVVAGALAAGAAAHYTLDYPTSRGFEEPQEVNFCGGFATNTTGRHAFPLTGPAHVTVNSHHPQWTLAILLSTEEDPKDFNAFNSSGSPNFLNPYASTSGTGPTCIPVDMTALHDKLNLKNGTLATLQTVYQGGDGNLYQCADLILVDNAPAGPACSNATVSGAGASGASSTGAAPSASAKSGAATLATGNALAVVAAGLVAAGLGAAALI